MPGSTATIALKVELFGIPRLRTGRREVDLVLPPQPSRAQVIQALAQACTLLVGNAIRDDLSGLQEGYVFNCNGTVFLADEDFDLGPGDILLLLSSQAGG